MPCHVLSCECNRFLGDSQSFLCPVCSREYATRASLEIHLYGQHPGLSPRERSVLLQGALHPHASLNTSLSRTTSRAETPAET
ncbi:MAG: hypothetical protein L3K17_03600 [Thermoplasmata archaeon]|nr:hypothetical protein [Thermoplasmata archaeon]